MIDAAKAAANKAAREERKKAYLRGLMDRYAERFRAIGDQDARSVAREVHAVIEEVLDRDRARSPAGGAIRCRKGCSHCCHGPVEIWPHEAALLIEAARAAGIELDEARLERQSRRTLDDWRRQPAADTACAFLGGDGACRVYASRPNACRKLLVLSDPVLCDGAMHPPERIERWFSWEAEILETAALEVFGMALMPAALLTELRKER
jgi:hypothetical protein